MPRNNDLRELAAAYFDAIEKATPSDAEIKFSMAALGVAVTLLLIDYHKAGGSIDDWLSMLRQQVEDAAGQDEPWEPPSL